MLIFPFFPVKLQICQAPPSEAIPSAESHISKGQPAGQAYQVNAQQSTLVDSAQDQASQEGGQEALSFATVNTASHAAQRLLGRVSLGLPVITLRF